MGLHSRRLSKDEKQNYRDEQRLLPGGQPKRDRRAIPIQPGSGPKKFESFKPTNTIGLRPGTRTNPTSSVLRPSFTTFTTQPKPSGLDDFAVIPDSDDEDITPPRKRLKTGSPEIIDLEDNDQPHTVPKSPSVDIIHMVEHSPPRTPVHRRKKKLENTSKYWPPEYNMPKKSPTMTPRQESGVDRMGDNWTSGSEDGQHANRARLEQVQLANGKPQKKLTSSNHNEGATLLPTVVVEVPKRKKIVEWLNGPKGGSNDCSAHDNIWQPNYDSRESPDELQGDKTISDSWRERDNCGRDVSPSDLRHSKFTTPIKTSQKSLSRREDKRIRKRPALVPFDISMFRREGFVANPLSRLFYNKDTSKFSIGSASDTSSSKLKNFDLMKAISMFYSEHADCGKVQLKFPKSQGAVDQVTDIEFASEQEKKKFWDILHEASPSLKRNLKDKDWMDRLFQAATSQPANTGVIGTLKRQSPRSIGATRAASSSASTKPKRTKLTANLGNGDQPATNRRADKLCHAHPSPSSPEPTLPIPAKTYRSSNITRETRSKSRKQNIEIDSLDEDEEPASTFIFDRPGKGWQKPLVYPETGKKKAEVEAHDLDRLRPHEFLNDNLIGLYIRFLEHHLERQHPELAKRVYFFNSYFFATLTNTPRGQRGINYQGVEKWTRSFDIFAFDYLVVPINEKAHWYVAIICNLPSLFSPEAEGGQSDAETPGNVPEITEIKPLEIASNVTTGDSERDAGNSDRSASEAIKEGQAQESFTSMTLKDGVLESSIAEDGKKEGPHENDDWPDEDENQVSSPTQEKKAGFPFGEAPESTKPTTSAQSEQAPKRSKSTKKRGQKNRPPGIRYDVKQPAIIVFDSLHCPRPPTIRILRDYLREEAQSKKSLTINNNKIKGMNANQIPHQPNFSDCGLYLLAYLEKFVQNPDHFVKSVLRKEMNRNTDWPAMKPGLFRSRLRKFLLDLYEEQEAQRNGERKKDEPLMVDAKSLNILLDNVPAVDDRETYDDAKEPKVPKNTPKPKDKRVTAEKQMTPTRSSPRHNKDGKDDSTFKSPRIMRADMPSSHHDSIFAELQEFVSTEAKHEVSGGDGKGRVQVPRTPPPASPEVINSSPVSLGSIFASPSRRSKRNFT
ncbi:hypothetical protein FQN49_003158 [Arthroderma sp. PD_2]|nr:hypothetical protein FQN49_003158 [Arthroderma sp. PD_2]